MASTTTNAAEAAQISGRARLGGAAVTAGVVASGAAMVGAVAMLGPGEALGAAATGSGAAPLPRSAARISRALWKRSAGAFFMALRQMASSRGLTPFARAEGAGG